MNQTNIFIDDVIYDIQTLNKVFHSIPKNPFGPEIIFTNNHSQKCFRENTYFSSAPSYKPCRCICLYKINICQHKNVISMTFNMKKTVGLYCRSKDQPDLITLDFTLPCQKY